MMMVLILHKNYIIMIGFDFQSSPILNNLLRHDCIIDILDQPLHCFLQVVIFLFDGCHRKYCPISF